MTKIVDVFVIEEHPSGKTIKCSIKDDEKDPFFLAKSQITPSGPVKKRSYHTFDVSEFAWKSHRQLCGDEIFEEEKNRRREWKQNR
jgi:hypothetical protein